MAAVNRSGILSPCNRTERFVMSPVAFNQMLLCIIGHVVWANLITLLDSVLLLHLDLYESQDTSAIKAG